MKHQSNSNMQISVTSIRGAWTRLYEWATKFILDLGELVQTTAHTLIVAFGVSLVLVLVLIVEQQRVQHGVALFEADSERAAHMAWAFVVTNLILEIYVAWIERQKKYTPPAPVKFSLARLKSELYYLIGKAEGKRWTARKQSPALRFRRLARLVTWTILVLAVSGSMQTAITAQEGKSWHEALLSILTASKLSDMATWASGGIAALALVYSAQALARYVAEKAASVERRTRTRETRRERQTERLFAQTNSQTNKQSNNVHSNVTPNSDQQRALDWLHAHGMTTVRDLSRRAVVTEYAAHRAILKYKNGGGHASEQAPSPNDAESTA